MLFGDLRSIVRASFQSDRLDQAGGVVVGRIAKHRTGIGQIQRLRCQATFQQLGDPLASGLAVSRRQAQPCRGEQLVAGILEPDMAIADGEVLDWPGLVS